MESDQQDNGKPDLPGGPGMKLFGKRYALPRSVFLRRVLGILLVMFGMVGFLPVVGFWMIPLGLLVLSHDSAVIRRWRRRVAVKWGRRGNGTAGK